MGDKELERTSSFSTARWMYCRDTPPPSSICIAAQTLAAADEARTRRCIPLFYVATRMASPLALAVYLAHILSWSSRILGAS